MRLTIEILGAEGMSVLGLGGGEGERGGGVLLYNLIFTVPAYQILYKII